MSIPDDGSTRPPRNPRRGPQPLPTTEFDDQESTFRPAPGPSQPAPKRKRPNPAGGPTADANPSSASRARSKPELRGGKPPLIERVVFGSVRSTDLATFCRQFGGYLDAGVDLLNALSSLEKQFSKTALGPVINRVHLAIRKGSSLSEAMEKEPRAFDRLMRSMMRVAEARGGMPEVLRQLAQHFENRVRLLRRARSAMIYPIAVLLIASAVGYLLTVFVLPPLVDMLQDMSRGRSVVLPAPTRALMALSAFMTGIGWWLVPLLAVGTLFFLLKAYRTSPGKDLMDRIALRLPVLGSLLQKLDTTRFSRTLSTLLEAGRCVRRISSTDRGRPARLAVPSRRGSGSRRGDGGRGTERRTRKHPTV